MVFSVWNGCSQFGDFLALSVSYIIIEQADASPGIFLLTMAALLVGIFLLNKKFLPEIA
jgi:sugar phosphate permease